MSFVINYNSKKISRLTKIVRKKFYFLILSEIELSYIVSIVLISCFDSEIQQT